MAGEQLPSGGKCWNYSAEQNSHEQNVLWTLRKNISAVQWNVYSLITMTFLDLLWQTNILGRFGVLGIWVVYWSFGSVLEFWGVS